MYYSLTFNDQKNTWDDWGLIPESPPQVEPPAPVTNFVTIPGRRQGALDLSKSVFGKLTYERITGNWVFLKEFKNKSTRMTTYQEIRYWLHGRTCKVKLEDDPNHYYMGMFTVSAPQGGSVVMRISIGFNLEPVRYNTNGTIDSTFVQEFA